MKKIAYYFWGFALIFMVLGCEKDPKPNPLEIKPEQDERIVYITNEGNFGDKKGASLTIYYPKSGKIINDAFYRVNNETYLGDVAQSSSTFKDELYIVVNNSSWVQVVDPETIKFKASIFDYDLSPRYIEFLSPTKAYLSDLYANRISIFNPETKKIIGHVPLPKLEVKVKKRLKPVNVEQMVRYKDLVFGCWWSYGDKVVVINTTTDAVVDNIQVGYQPNSMVIDKNNKIWVLCDGGYPKLEKSKLQRLDPETRKIDFEVAFDDPKITLSELQIDGKGENIYFLVNGGFIKKNQEDPRFGVYKMNVDSEKYPDAPIIKEGNDMLFYGLGIDPKTSEIYIADAIDYQQKGVIYHYNASGGLIRDFKAGIIPGAFSFN
ncbi:MAG: DUF5074 domain-containing protein [Bacteroidales bacterium]